ncbi:MAG: ferritin [Flavobacteriales bacterium]|jgi:ferritin
MLSSKVEDALNKQIQIEAASSQFYLAMASWAETQGFNGTSLFLYHHSDEERMHMLKLVKFVNERGGKAIVPALEQPPHSFSDLTQIFQTLLDHEMVVTQEINDVVDICLNEKDYSTHNFMQWYVSEQIEEEALARNIMDKLKMIGADKGGMYLFDRDLENLSNQPVPKVA